MSADDSSVEAATLEAYKEVVQLMLGFRTRAEMEDAFRRPLVWAAVKRLGAALDETRRRGQADEFALAAAIEAELVQRFAASSDPLDAMFNDPTHHSLPTDELTARITAAWAAKQ
jgi:hypothetical protein